LFEYKLNGPLNSLSDPTRKSGVLLRVARTTREVDQKKVKMEKW